MNTAKIFIVLGITIAIVAGVIVFIKQEEWSQNIDQEQKAQSTVVNEKIYVALEGEGKVAIIDSARREVLAAIDLSDQLEPLIGYMAHNVQVAPNGKSVWVTANAMNKMAMDGSHSEEGADSGHNMEKMMGMTEMIDQVIVIDPLTDKIIRRIPIAKDSHLAHVALSPDGKKAYVTAQEKGFVYTINVQTFEIEKTIDLGEQSGPHGLRISPDGTKKFIALLDGKALAIVDTLTNKVQKHLFDSGAVQTAVTPDGRFVFVSLYAARQVARLDVSTREIEKINLPAEAKGPVQLYPAPDSRFIYIADQGYYFGQPIGNKVYKIGVESGIVEKVIAAGTAPHGVVVDSAGEFAYVTNLLSDDVSIIDVKTNKEIGRIPVGDMPNGISIWHALNGGTP